MMPDNPRRTTIVLGPDDTVELVREPCDCPAGTVCPPDGLFAEACPRRPHDDAELRRINERAEP